MADGISGVTQNNTLPISIAKASSGAAGLGAWTSNVLHANMITITKAGYETKVLKITLNDKMDRVISLKSTKSLMLEASGKKMFVLSSEIGTNSLLKRLKGSKCHPKSLLKQKRPIYQRRGVLGFATLFNLFKAD